MSIRRRLLAVCLIGAVATIGFSAYAFTASNTVPDSSAGDGTSVVSGYTVTALAYGLNGATPTNIDSVAFTIAPIAAGTVKAKINSVWYGCTVAALGAVTCDTTVGTQLTVTPVTSLEALAVQ